MALIILKHREHGTTYKDNELEAQECERNGWIRVKDSRDNPFKDEIDEEIAPKVEPFLEKKFNRREHMKRMWAEGRMRKKGNGHS